MKNFFYPLIIYFSAFIFRLVISLPGMGEPENFFHRPDSMGYINPAFSLIQKTTYNVNSSSETKEVSRPPLTAVFFAVIFLLKKIFFLSPVIMFCLIFSCIPLLIYYIAKELGLNSFFSFLSAMAASFNMTLAAHTSLFLSDSLFTAAIALIILFLIKALKSGKLPCFSAVFFLWGVSVLIRPTSLHLFIPLLLISFFFQLKNKKKILLIAFFSLLLPMSWMYRNYYYGAGFNVGTGLSDHIFNIISIVESEQYNCDNRTIKKALLKEANDQHSGLRNEALKGAVLQYAKKEFKKSIAKHPLKYLRKSIANFYILLPDLPTFSQLLKLSTGQKGTLYVLQEKGFLKAVQHYFRGKYILILYFFPIIFVSLVMLLAAFLEFLFRVFEKDIFFCSLFLTFVIYFVLQGIAVTVPRYQLPALPFLCVTSGFFMKRVRDSFEKK